MSLTITLIQTHLHWEDKQANLQMLEQKIRSINVPTHVIVLPEMFNTGFSMKPKELAETMDGKTVQWMKRLSAEKRSIVTGSIIIEDATDYYNRMLWVLPNGHVAWYDKRHRFAFAGEDKHYTAGQKRTIASVNGWKINLQVCYDLRFPVWARQTPLMAQMRQHQPEGQLLGDKVELSHDSEPRKEHSLEDQQVMVKTEHPIPSHEYDVLLYVANWPQRRSHAWKSLLTARAIENQCYVIGVNRIGEDGNGIYHSGNSCVIEAFGERLYDKADVEDIFTITLQKAPLEEARKKFPFWKDADDFMIK
jgi:predicted amidohydrolase